MSTSFKDILHAFCLWCASSVLIALICYVIYECAVRFVCATINLSRHADDMDEEANNERFDDVATVLRELQVEAPKNANTEETTQKGYEVEVVVEPEGGTQTVTTANDVESGIESVIDTPVVIKRIVVKPWSPD